MIYLVLSLTFYSMNLNAGLNITCTENCGDVLGTEEQIYKACDTKDESYQCDPIYQNMMSELSTIFDLATIGICSASKSAVEQAGIDIPPCSEKGTLDQSDPRSASSGVFIAYTTNGGENSNTIKEFINAFRENDNGAVINMVIDIEYFDSFMADSELQEFLKEKKINFIPIATSTRVGQWMQDSFQFVTIDQKPAIYQLEQYYESQTAANLDLNQRLACQIAKQCDIPYYAPESLVEDPLVPESSLNAGGNLEVMPGGSYIQGTIQTYFSGRANNPQNMGARDVPYKTAQQQLRSGLGNRIIDLDVSFLHVGHVDEMVNFVKTDKDPPCDFAVLYASPNKAIEMMQNYSSGPLIENTAFSKRVDRVIRDYLNERYEGNMDRVSRALERWGIDENDPCTLLDRTSLSDLMEFDIQEFNESYQNLGCINRTGRLHSASVRYSNFIESDKFRTMVEINQRDYLPILNQNKERILSELSATSGCTNPSVIDVPVLYDEQGGSFFPNGVNGLVQNISQGHGSHLITPDSTFPPFNSYLRDELAKEGITSSFIDGETYHNNQGEIHCGTNQIPLCN